MISITSILRNLILPIVLFSGIVLASPVADLPINVAQPATELPGGNPFKIHPKGDEWGNWYETDDGYSVIKDKQTGVWHYGALDAQKKLRPSGKIVGRDRPQTSGIKLHLRPAPSAQQPQGTSPFSNALSATALDQASTSPRIGNVPTLFILVQFSDRVGTYTAANFSGLLSNQLAAYFREASYNRFNITPATESHGTPNDGIVGWLTLNQNHPNTEGTTSTLNQQLAKNAIVAADTYVNFAAYDINSDGYLDSNELAIVVISAGYETSFGGTTCTPFPSVWGHQWSIEAQIVAPVVDGKIVGDWHNNAGGYAQFGEIHGLTTAAGCNPANLVRYANHQATIGIMAHELGHLILRLPDLYDTTFASEGIGSFSLMAGGNWAFKTTDPYQGQSPVHPDAWCKLYSGWVDPVIDSIGPITLPATGGSGVNATNAVYMQTTSDPNQYFLFENRGQYGYDAGLSGLIPGITGITGTPGGIAVWNVDETVRMNASNPWAPNNTPDHKFIDLEEADNVSTMDTGSNRGESNDLYFAGNKAVFDNISSPNSRLYNGTSTGIALNSISTLGQNMTANFGSVLQAQTITFGTAPVVTVGGTGTLSATASSGLAVTFSSTTTATCTLSGSKVTGVAAGACVVAANQAGNATYAAAPQVTQTITIAVGGAGQTVTAPAPITIRDNASASLYPAPVTISGMTGAITKVVVTVKGLTHAFARDIDMLLVGPGGQKAILMSDTIGGTGYQ